MRAQYRGFESHSVQLIFSNGFSECRFPLLAYPTFSPHDVFMYNACVKDEIHMYSNFNVGNIFLPTMTAFV